MPLYPLLACKPELAWVGPVREPQSRSGQAGEVRPGPSGVFVGRSPASWRPWHLCRPVGCWKRSRWAWASSKNWLPLQGRGSARQAFQGTNGL